MLDLSQVANFINVALIMIISPLLTGIVYLMQLYSILWTYGLYIWGGFQPWRRAQPRIMFDYYILNPMQGQQNLSNPGSIRLTVMLWESCKMANLQVMVLFASAALVIK